MKKHFFKPVALLFAAIMTTSSFSFALGCSKTEAEKETRYPEYDLYVQAMAEKGDSVKSYEDWLASIKGEDGKDGKDGEDGKDGSDGRGIVSATVSADGHLLITYTDSATPVDLGVVVGKDGEDGKDGNDSTSSSWYNGTADPAADFGTDGDFYIDTDDYLLYKKENSVWNVVLHSFGGDPDSTQYYKNLFNYNDADNKVGYLINDSTGELTSTTTSLMTTHFLPVENGKTYLFNVLPKMPSNMGQSLYNIYGYDENKQYIGKAAGGKISISTFDNNGTTDDKEDDILSVKVNNAKIKYLRYTISTAGKGNFMFVEKASVSGAEWPYTYVAFGSRLAIPGTEPSTGGMTDSERELLLASNPLYKKKIAWEGDSICEGAGCAGGYAKIIAENNYMSSVNKAISGGTITSGTGKHCIVDGVVSMAGGSNYDYIIFDGGVNDKSQSNPVTFGEISVGYSATLDKTTFCGSFETCCKALALSGKKVGYIFVHKIFNYDDALWNETYRPNIIKMLEKWGIPYLDLEILVPPLNLIPELKSTYTNNSDGWHPNEAGYKTFYVDKITAWLKTL